MKLCETMASNISEKKQSGVREGRVGTWWREKIIRKEHFWHLDQMSKVPYTESQPDIDSPDLLKC